MPTTSPSAPAATPPAAPPAAATSTPRRPVWRRRSLRTLRWVGAGLALLVLLALAAWLLLQWTVLPHIERWRPALEARASDAIGAPVRIGAIRTVDVDGPGFLHWTRAIELRDVVVAQRSPAAGSADAALRLPRVLAALSPASLLPGWDGRWRWRFDTLQLDGPQLDARREADGRIVVAGFLLGGAASAAAQDDGDALDWFFSQHGFSVRDGRITWTDALRGEPPLVFDAVALSVRNGVRRHVVQLEATPPAAWGQRVTLRGEFRQPFLGRALSPSQPTRGGPSAASATPPAPARLLSRPGDWRRWQGSVDAELPGFDAAAVQRAVDLPQGWRAGQGSARVHVELRQAQPVAGTADVDLRGVLLQPTPGEAPLAIDRLHGRIAARDAAEGGELQLLHAGVSMADGSEWPAADASLHWRRGADGRIDGGVLRANRVELAAVQHLVGQLPARWQPQAPAEWLAQLAPRGSVRGLDAEWDGPPEAPRRFRVRATLRALSLQAGAAPEAGGQVEPGRPGIENADVDVDATDTGGTARLALRAGALDVPGVLEPSRVPLDRLDAQLAWRIDRAAPGQPPQIGVQVRELVLANADMQADLSADWTTGDAPSAPAAGAASVARALASSVASASAAPAPAAPAAAAVAAVTAPGARFPGRLDMTGRITRADATKVARYLPLGIASDARGWVAGALQAGRASANFRVHGDLDRFPFSVAAEARGRAGAPATDDQFRVAVQVDGVRLAYVPPAADAPSWPAFTDVKGEVVFDRDALELKALHARLGGVGDGQFELSGVHGGIRRLAHDATLRIDGAGRGPMADLIAFVRRTPIDAWTNGAVTQMAPAGPAQPPVDLDLALTLPLADLATATVNGKLRLAGNDLRLRADVPVLAAANAQVAFTERGFDVTEGSARALGGDIRFDASQPADGRLQVNVRGTATAEGLRQAPELGLLTQAAQRFAGQAGYQLHYALTGGQPEFAFQSDLAGLALNLPAPLGKPAEQPMPLRVDTALLPGPGAGPPRDDLRVLLGTDSAPLLHAQWQRELTPVGPRVLRGGIGVQAHAPMPADGVAALVRVPLLDADAWQQVADTFAGAPAAAAAPQAASAQTAPDAAAAAVDLAYAPSSVALHADQIVTNGRRLHRLVAGLSRGAADASLWRGNVAADELDGYVEYRAADAGRGVADATGRIYARLARLAVPDDDTDDTSPGGSRDAVTSLLEEAPPTGVPALDIVVDDFALRGKQLGRLEIQARNRSPGKTAGAAGGDTRGWALSRFRVGTPEAQLDATGQWLAGTRASGGRPRAVMDFKLDVADGGGLLARLGQPGVIKGARGRMSGQINWLGSPLAIDYPSLSGKVSASFERGQFLQAEPGIAKLLGVLSLQSLPRRLLLDFRDVFQQGFAFDNVGGDLSLAQGVASTRNLRMRGVQAVVLMEGRADVVRETQDLSVWVVPEFNTGAASLAVAAINPAIGLGSFVAQWLLRRPIVEAGTREFHVSGSWAEPQVDRVEKRARDAPPPADGADTPLPPDVPLPDPTAAPSSPTSSAPTAPASSEPQESPP